MERRRQGRGLCLGLKIKNTHSRALYLWALWQILVYFSDTRRIATTPVLTKSYMGNTSFSVGWKIWVIQLLNFYDSIEEVSHISGQLSNKLE